MVPSVRRPHLVVEERVRDEYEIAPELQRELLKHPGEWVAITSTRLLATGKSAKQALKRARRKGVDTPIVYRVPEDNGTTYFF